MRERGAQLRAVEHDAVVAAGKLQLNDRAQHLLAARLLWLHAAEQRLHGCVGIAAVESVAPRGDAVAVGGAHAGCAQHARALPQLADELLQRRPGDAECRDADGRRDLLTENARAVRHGDDRAAGGGQHLRRRAQLRQGRLRGRPAQIRFAVGHGRRAQRQQGGGVCAQRLHAAQELCDGGGVCTEHTDAREVVCLHDGHLLTKKVSAKRVWPYLSGDCDPSGNALASKRHHCALKYKVFSTRHAGREKAVSASGS